MRFTAIITFLAVIILFFIFSPLGAGNKNLLPANLLVATYSPWKYEPVAGYPSGPPNKPIGFDDVRQFFPNRKLLRDSLVKGIIPLWNPYIYSGTPFMAAFDTAVWYPLSWIAALLPVIAGWNFLVIIQPVLSLLFMYLFLRSLKFEPKIAAYGSFIWAFAGFMIVYWQEILVLEHSFLWLPLALYASNRLKADGRDRTGFFLLVFSLVCSVFAGFLQMAIYVYVLVIIWNIVTKNMRALAGIAVSLPITAIQIVPSAAAYLSSPRGGSDGLTTFSHALLPLRNVLTLVAPDFWGNPATYNYFGGVGFYFEKMIYVGIIPLLFALYGIFEGKNKRILFWTLVAGISLSLGFALPTSWLPYMLRLPVLANSYPTRVFGIWAFAAAVLSCYGLTSFLKQPNVRRAAIVLGFLTAVLVSGWFVVLLAWNRVHLYQNILFTLTQYFPGISADISGYITVSARNLLLPTVFTAAGWGILILRKYFAKTVFVYVVVLTVMSGLYFAHKYVYFSDAKFVYPPLAVTSELSRLSGYTRVWGYGNAFIESNFPEYFGWYSTDGYGNLSSGRYAQLLSTIINSGKLGGPVRRSDTDLYGMSQRDVMTGNPYRLRMMSLLGVKFIVETKKDEQKSSVPVADRFPSPLFSLVWQDDTWRIWQYTQAIPRVIFASNYLVARNDQDGIDRLYDPNIHLADTVILEKNPDIALKKGGKAPEAHIISYDLNRVTIRTDSGSDGFLLLTDNYDPGWHATVDGVAGTIFRADYSFKAVPVPSGIHTVVFYYLPPTVLAGAAISAAGIIVSVIFFIIMRKNKTVS